MPFSINVQGLNLTPTSYRSYCTKAHSNLRCLFHYCLINLLIAMSLLLLPFNYPAALQRVHTEIRTVPVSSLSHRIFHEINSYWLYSKRHCLINISFLLKNMAVLIGIRLSTTLTSDTHGCEVVQAETQKAVSRLDGQPLDVLCGEVMNKPD